jgi:hypothetical protein
MKKAFLILGLVLFNFGMSLFAQNYPGALTEELSGRTLSNDVKKLVICVHGWNPPPFPAKDAYSAGNWPSLVLALKQSLNNSSGAWGLGLYHWETDANTGLIEFSPELAAIGVDDATKAATRAFTWHGPHLAQQLNELAPGLREVHFVAHSAGSWLASSAASHLLALNNSVVVQITLLDPFIPGTVQWPFKPDTLLGMDAMNSLATSPNQNRIFRLENYYSSPDKELGTDNPRFTWRDDIDIEGFWTAWNGVRSRYYGHSGPILFYADEVSSSDPRSNVAFQLLTAGFDYHQFGWWRSLFMNEPVWRPDRGPIDQEAEIGQSVTFMAAFETRAASSDSASRLHFEWQRNGQVIRTNSGTLRIASVTASDAGTYVVVARNSAGSATSRSATLTLRTKAASIAVTESISFDPVQVGNRATKDVLIRNTGSADLAVNSVSYSASSLQSIFALNFSPVTIPAGGSKQISVTFVPAEATSYDGTITFSSNAESKAVRLSGLGTALAKLPTIQTSVPEVAGTSVIFRGTVNPNGLATKVYFQYSTDSNFASFKRVPAQDKDIGSETSDFAVTETATELLPNTPHWVRLMATSSAGTQPGPKVQFTTGPATVQVYMQVVETQIDFGNGTIPVGNTDSRVITISNLSTSNGPLIGSVAPMTEPLSVTSGSGPFYLQPGQSKLIAVQFAPKNETSYNSPLEITHNASNLPGGSKFVVAVKGTGKNLKVGIQVSPNPIVFENVPVGGVSNQWVRISNPAPSTGNLIGSVGGLSSPFNFCCNPNFAVGPGEGYYQVQVSFVPSSQGEFKGQFVITHNAGNSPLIVPVIGKTPITRLSIRPALIDFGDVRVGQSASQTVIIQSDPSSTGDVVGAVTWKRTDGSIPFYPPFNARLFGKGNFVLSPGQSNEYVIDFTPVSVGTFTGTFGANRNDDPQNPLVVQLRGSGIPAAPPQSYTLNISASNGTVTKNPDQGSYAPGTPITLTATPASGFAFGSWGGDASGVNPSVQLVMDRNRSVTANFIKPTVAGKTLAVASSNPGSGVSIAVSPNDSTGLNDGATPFNRTFGDNASVILAAPASAGGNIFQKWQRDGSDAANTPTVTVTMDRDHTMTAVYAAPVGPSIATQPLSQSVEAGGIVTFSIVASGTEPLSYQWQFNGTPITGANSSILTLSNVQQVNVGSYSVRVSNSVSSATSNPATLTVNPPVTAPKITEQPQSQNVVAGGSVTFKVTASGTAPLSYQWRLNGAIMAGANSATLTLNNVSTSQSGQKYSVLVSNSAGSVTSQEAVLTVTPPPPTGSLRIGLNFGAEQINGSKSASLKSGDRAGVVPQANWNNLEGASGSASNLTADREGSVVPAGISVRWNSNNTWASTGLGEENNNFTGADRVLNTGYLDTGDSTTTTVTITGIPQEMTSVFYDVIVYTTASVAGRAGGYRITSTSGQVLKTYLANTGSFLAFQGLTAREIVVEASTEHGLGRADRPRAPVNAIQLVPTILDTTKLPTDRTLPLISTFSADLSDVTLGSAVKISFTVSDAGGAGLKQVEFFRARINGFIWDPTRQRIGNPITVSGNSSFSGNFSDTPQTVGTYWYGMHVVDGADNTMDERSAGVGPIKVTVIPLTAVANNDDPRGTAPVITSVNSTTFSVGQAGSFRVTATGTPAPTFAAVGLPTWASLNPTTGVISGTPPNLSGAPFSFVITASNGIAPNAIQAFTLNIQTLGPFVATHSSEGYQSDGTATVNCTITYSGQPSALGWSVAIPSGWSYQSGQNEPGVHPSPGESGTLAWAWTSIPPSPVQFSYTLRVPAGESGQKSLSATASKREAGQAQQTTATPNPLLLNPRVLFHSADTDHDWKINLPELLRVIELYNYRSGTARTGQYHVESGTDDGFGLGPGSQAGGHHSADTDHDWKLSLAELLRVIELYNYRSGTTRTGEYHAQTGTDDGYELGPAVRPAQFGGVRSDIALANVGGGSALQTASRTTYLANGNDIIVQCQISFTGTLSTLGWQATIPDGWSYVSGLSEPDVKPSANDTGTLNWAWISVPASPVQFSYTLRIPPGQIGQKLVTGKALYRASGKSSESSAATLAFNPEPGVAENNCPTISSIPNQRTSVNNGTTDIITFTVADDRTLAGELVVTAISDNSTLVPNGNIQFAPIDPSDPGRRRMIIKSNAVSSGQATITILVRDKDGCVTNTTFVLTVQGYNPTISSIPDQTVPRGGTVGPIPFTVSDKETFPGFLKVTASSSNKSFLTDANIVFGGSGENRTVTVGPVASADGSTTVTLTVTDNEGLTATATFRVATPEIATVVNMQVEATIDFGSGIVPIGNSDSRVITMSNPTSSNGSLIGSVAPMSAPFSVTSGDGPFSLQPGQSRFIVVQFAPQDTDFYSRSLAITHNASNQPLNPYVVVVKGSGKRLNVGIDVSPTSISFENVAVNGSQMQWITISNPASSTGNLNGNLSGLSSPFDLPGNNNFAIGPGGSFQIPVRFLPTAHGVFNGQITVTHNAGAPIGIPVFGRTTTITIKGDFNGDGKSDLIFQDNSGFLAAWFMDGFTLKSADFLAPKNVDDSNYRIAGSGDFNGDGQEDLVFQHTDGTLAVWIMNGITETDATMLNPSNPGDRNWRVLATGDIDRDGKTDLVFQHADGTLAVWFMDGIKLKSGTVFNPSNPGDKRWKVVGVGDFDGDGSLDLVFQHADGTLAVWFLKGTAMSRASLLSPSNPGAAWHVVSVVDRNGDGKPDLLFQHNNLDLAVWLMDGTKLSSAQYLSPRNPGGTWKVVAPR